MRSFVEMNNRPFRAPRTARHFQQHDVIVMEWQIGLALYQTEVIEFIPAERPSDRCAGCGHDRCFHQIGTGHGVPLGVEFCDDRHGPECNCIGFEPRY